MIDLRSAAKFLGAYAAGVVTAGFFLSAPIQRPAVLQHAPDFLQQNDAGGSQQSNAGWVLVPPTMPFVEPLANPALANPPAEQQEQSPSVAAPVQPQPPNVTTTGSAAGATTQQTVRVPDEDEQPNPGHQAQNSCNYSLCRRYYRSFDEATCTYQPHGGPRQLCKR